MCELCEGDFFFGQDLVMEFLYNYSLELKSVIFYYKKFRHRFIKKKQNKNFQVLIKNFHKKIQRHFIYLDDIYEKMQQQKIELF